MKSILRYKNRQSRGEEGFFYCYSSDSWGDGLASYERSFCLEEKFFQKWLKNRKSQALATNVLDVFGDAPFIVQPNLADSITCIKLSAKTEHSLKDSDSYFIINENVYNFRNIRTRIQNIFDIKLFNSFDLITCRPVIPFDLKTDVVDSSIKKKEELLLRFYFSLLNFYYKLLSFQDGELYTQIPKEVVSILDQTVNWNSSKTIMELWESSLNDNFININYNIVEDQSFIILKKTLNSPINLPQI